MTTADEVSSLLRLVTQLEETAGEQVDAIAAQNVILVEQGKELRVVNRRLEEFVPKGKFRAAVVSLALSALMVLGFAIWTRADAQNDTAREQRQLVAGCERGNEQRATQREVIETAVRAGPIPDGVSVELREAYERANERTLALRVKLLSLPGVQPVDCQAAFKD